MERIKKIGKVLMAKGFVFAIATFYTSLMMIVVLFQWARKGKEFWVVKERRLPPFILQDPSFGRHSFVNLKEVKIHYVENGDRSKPLILFLHGFPEFWFSWKNQLKHFSKDYWVVAVDMRGYGDSEKPSSCSAYKMENLRKDVVDVVEALGRKSCILVGHDWGGVVAWEVAAHYPQIVEKLVVLNAPHPSAFRKKIESSLKQFLKSWYIFAFQLPFFPELYIRTEDLEMLRHAFENKLEEEELEAYKYIWAREGAWTPPINYYRNAMGAEGLLDPIPLPPITPPTLIIWGENDVALEKDLTEMARPFVEDLKIIFVPNANHFVQNDKPVEVNRAIEEFVRGN